MYLHCSYGGPYPLITVRISEDLKRKMKQVKSVNWSEVVRRAILERIIIEEKARSKDWDAVRRAAKGANELRMKLQAWKMQLR